MKWFLNFAVCLSVLLVMMGCSEKSSKNDVLLAQKNIKDGEFRKAEIILKQALSENLTNQHARGLLGLSRFKQGDWAQAIIEWDKLIDSKEIVNISPQRIVALFFLNKHEDLSEIQDDQVEAHYVPRLNALKAVSTFRENKSSNQEAVEKVKLNLDVSSEDPVIWYLLALLQFNNGEIDGAKSSVEQSLRFEPDNFLAISLLGDIQNKAGNKQAALTSYSEVVDSYPWRAEDRFKRAFIYISEKQFSSAQKDLDALKKQIPNSIYVNYAQGLIDLQEKNYEDAISNFQMTTSRADIFPESLLYLATANMMMDNISQSVDYAQRYSSARPDSNVSKLMMANIQVFQKNFQEAIDLISPIYPEVKANPDVVKTYAVALLSSGRSQDAEKIISEALTQGTESESLYVLSATISLENDFLDEAYKAAEAGVVKYPDSYKLEQIILVYFVRSGNFEQAIAKAKEGVVRHNNSARSLNTLSDIHRLTGDKDESVRILQNIVDLYPGNPSANFKLASYSRSNDDLATASKFYKNVLDENPRNKEAAISRFSVLAASGEDEEAVKTIEKSISYHPYDLDLKNALAKYYIIKGQAGKVPVLYSSSLDKVYQNRESYGLLIRSKMEMKSYKDALYDLERYANLMPDSPIPSYMMATIFGQMGEVDSVEGYLKQSLKVSPDYLPAKIAYAKYLLRYKSELEFQKYAEDLYSDHKGNHEVDFIYSRLLEKKGKFEESLAYAKAYYDKTGDISGLKYWSYVCSKMKSIACLDDSERFYKYSDDEDLVAGMQLANLYMFNNENQGAITVYEKIINQDPDNVVALNNVSWLYLSINKQKSLSYSRRADSLQPDSPDVLDTLAYSLLANGYDDEAIVTIDKANRLSPNNYTLLYHSADIKSQSGGEQDAIKILNEILESDKEFPERAKAVSLLSSLK